MKTLVFIFTLFFVSGAHADGGISSLAGVGETLAFLYSAIVLLIVWLTFSLVILFDKRKRMNRLKVFRKTIMAFSVLGLFVILVMSLLVFQPHWEILAVFVIFSISIIGLTELEIVFFQKKHNKKPKFTAQQAAPRDGANDAPPLG